LCVRVEDERSEEDPGGPGRTREDPRNVGHGRT
jgi:hypothetical protein